MKKILGLLTCLTLSLGCLTGCSVDINEVSLQSNYVVDNQTDYQISELSGLGLKYFKYDDSTSYLLAYLDDNNIEVNNENGYVKSLSVGKTCISLTSSVLDIGRRINENIMLDLLARLNTQMNSERAEKVCENMCDIGYYIISENEEYVFIDYLTTIPNISSKVAYYRIILQDVSLLGTELTDEELAILPDNLPELLDILGITENIELPIKVVEDDLEE